MDEQLWLRAIAGFVVDGSLAVLCGLLLASAWMGSVIRLRMDRGSLGLFAGLLFLGSSLQLVLLAVSFGGESSPRAVIGILPDVVGMHVGEVMAGLCVTAAGLCAMCWIRSAGVRDALCGVMVLVCLGLHGSTGHAAVDGTLSLTEALQWAHLLGMALWSGGVLVSGLFVVPRLHRLSEGESLDSAREYLGKLSLVSTWAVGVVVVSGVLKGYRATDGSVGLLRSSHWGQLLVVKSAVVLVTIFLGARNRWLLRSKSGWDRGAMRKVAGTLRFEAVAMLVVLLLSAWLANSVPPLE